MLKKRINKLHIHLTFTKQKNDLKQLRTSYTLNNLYKTKNSAYSLKRNFFLFCSYMILVSKTWEFNYYWINFNYSIKHNDYALIKRELFILILIWAKLLLFCNLINFSLKKKKISVLRSPFVYSNTKEQFEICNLKISINFLEFTNILSYNYFSILNKYFNNYSLLKINKYFK